MQHNGLKKAVAGTLAGLMMLATLPLAAMAAETKTEAKQKTVTQSYINAATGKEISDRTSYQKNFVEYKPQELKGYTYKSYTEAEEEIYDSKCTQYIIGYPDKTVQMEGDLTRAEAATIFYRLYEGEYPQSLRHLSKDTFADVKPHDWYYDAVAKLYDLGVADSKADKAFSPNVAITRAEFAVLAARFGSLTDAKQTAFSDVQKGHWAFSEINAAAEKGWINGYPDGTFRPDHKITRAETMKLVNHVVNREITPERLKTLGIQNPYLDLVTSHWAYNHAMEATVSHNDAQGASAWHPYLYKDGKYNLQIERFVDEKGNVLAEEVTKAIVPNKDAKKIPAFHHIGTLNIRTYVYSQEKSSPGVEKTANVKEARVGEKITYTVKVSNAKNAAVDMKKAVFTDALPVGLDFNYGSVTVDGKNTSAYTYSEETRLLTVELGNLKIGQEAAVKFVATVNDKAYHTTIQNLATVTSDNSDPVQDKDDGVVIADGKTDLGIKKTVDLANAKVGDILTYTVAVTNGKAAQVNARGVVVTDEIPSFVTFNGKLQLEGYSHGYSYNNRTGVLTVHVGDIAPEQTKTITFEVVVNDTAYGQTFQNTAIAGGDNTEEVSDTDDGTTVDPGKPEGHVGSKTVNKTQAKVGETVTYTIELSNHASATADWTTATIQDTIPDYMSFAGNVTLNGETTTEYTYHAGSKLLNLIPGAIAPGAKAVYTFDVEIEDGAQGKTILNTAVLEDGGEETKLPSDPVVVDAGKTKPILAKSNTANSPIELYDVFDYVVTVKNGNDATATWKDITFTDTLPSQVELAGNVYVDGDFAQHSKSGNTISVFLGNLKPSESLEIRIPVKFMGGAPGDKFINTATAEGENGKASGSDDGIKIPEDVLDPQKPDPDKEQSKYITKDVDKTTVNLNTDILADKQATFKIEIGNNTSEVWKNVVVEDVLDTSKVTLISDAFYINGVQKTFQNGWTMANGKITALLGDIQPHAQPSTIQFTVEFKSDCEDGSTYLNTASAKGDNYYDVASAPEVTILNPHPMETKYHAHLFKGRADGSWSKNEEARMLEVAIVAYRQMTAANLTAANGTVHVPDYIGQQYSGEGYTAIHFMIRNGIIPASEFDTSSGSSHIDTGPGYVVVLATNNNIKKMVEFATKKNVGISGNTYMSRIDFATMMCDLTGRDKSPDYTAYNGNLATFTDVTGKEDVIVEVSNSHDYMLDSTNKHETWVVNSKIQ